MNWVRTGPDVKQFLMCLSWLLQFVFWFTRANLSACHPLPLQIQNIQLEREMALASNRSLAEQNLDMKPRLESQKEALVDRYCQLEAVRDAYRQHGALRGRRRQVGVMVMSGDVFLPAANTETHELKIWYGVLFFFPQRINAEWLTISQPDNQSINQLLTSHSS